MTQQYKKQYIILVVVFVLLVLGLLSISNGPISKSSNTQNIPVYIADSPAERTKGLSGRTMLPENRGMLFVFSKDGKHSIWMKDMKFNIDVVWLNSKNVVVDSEQNISPDTYPKTFTPRIEARYILEMAAGQVLARNISKGTHLSFTTVVD